MHNFEELKEEDEEEEVILEKAGLAKALLKELENGVVLLIFNESEEDKQTGEYFGKELFKLVDRKEIAKG